MGTRPPPCRSPSPLPPARLLREPPKARLKVWLKVCLKVWLKAQPSRPLVDNQRRYYGDDGMFVDGRSDTVFDPNRQAAE